MKIRTVEAKLPEWIFTCAKDSALCIGDLKKIFKVSDSLIDGWIRDGLFPEPDFRITRNQAYFFQGNNKREWFVKTIIKFAKQNEAQL